LELESSGSAKKKASFNGIFTLLLINFLAFAADNWLQVRLLNFLCTLEAEVLLESPFFNVYSGLLRTRVLYFQHSDSSQMNPHEIDKVLNVKLIVLVLIGFGITFIQSSFWLSLMSLLSKLYSGITLILFSIG